MLALTLTSTWSLACVQCAEQLLEVSCPMCREAYQQNDHQQFNVATRPPFGHRNSGWGVIKMCIDFSRRGVASTMDGTTRQGGRGGAGTWMTRKKKTNPLGIDVLWCVVSYCLTQRLHRDSRGSAEAVAAFFVSVFLHALGMLRRCTPCGEPASWSGHAGTSESEMSSILLRQYHRRKSLDYRPPRNDTELIRVLQIIAKDTDTESETIDGIWHQFHALTLDPRAVRWLHHNTANSSVLAMANPGIS